DGSLLVGGPNPSPEKYTITAPTKLTGITAIRLEVLPDQSLPMQGPGRAGNGNFVLSQLSLAASKPGDESNAKPVAFGKATADFSQDGWPIQSAVDGTPKKGWAVSPQFGKPHVAIVELAQPLTVDGGASLIFKLDQQYEGKDHNIGRLRLAVTTAKPPIAADGSNEAIAKILGTPAEQRNDQQKGELAKYYRALDPELAKLNQQLAKAQAAVAAQQDYERRLAEYQKRVAALAESEKQLPARQAEWEKTARNLSTWTVLEPGMMKATATLARQEDLSILASGRNVTPETYEVTVSTKVTGITAFRLEVMPDRTLPAQGPGRADNGNFVLNQFMVTASAAGDEANAKPVVLSKAIADFSQENQPVASAIDGQGKKGWAISPQFGQPHVALFELKEPLGFPNGTTITFKLDQLFEGKKHN